MPAGSATGSRAPPGLAGACLFRISTGRRWSRRKIARVARLEHLYGQGQESAGVVGRRYGVSLHRSNDGRGNSFFAREWAGTDLVSLNLYRLGKGNASLKPSEMPAEKVRDFVARLRLNSGGMPAA